MRKEMKSSMSLRRGLNALMALAMGLALIPSAHADKITRTNGRSLEGIIRKENAYYVYIDVRGTLVPVPRETIKEVTKLEPEDNARTLTDQAVEALSRGNINTARVLIDQAQSLEVNDPALVNTMQSFEAEVADMERRGGTPEERRRRAEAMLNRAMEAFDRIRLDEGKDLLIQALMIDPGFDKAHEQMNDLLTAPTPDLQLAALYFAEILWPDNVRDNSPVIPLLPRVYVDLVERQTASTETSNIQRNSDLIRIIAEAFISRPSWKMDAPAQTRAIIDQPLNVIMTNIIKKNMDDGLYQPAFEKLQTWARPEDSPETTLLYARALTGMSEFGQALNLLQTGLDRFASDTTLRAQYNALQMTLDALRSLQSGDVTTAAAAFNQIMQSRSTLAPEIITIVGRQLAILDAPRMEQLVNTPPYYEAADVAARVLEFGVDPLQKRRAAEIIDELITKVPWRLEVALMAGDDAIDLPSDIQQLLEQALGPLLAVTFDPQSSFVLRLGIGMNLTPENAAILIQSAQSGQPIDAVVFDTPLNINILRFSFEASHPSLGTMIQENWSYTSLPQAVAARRGIEGQEPAEDGKNVLLTVESLASISQFFLDDLADYMSKDLTLLTSHLEIPMVEEELAKAEPQE